MAETAPSTELFGASYFDCAVIGVATSPGVSRQRADTLASKDKAVDRIASKEVMLRSSLSDVLLPAA